MKDIRIGESLWFIWEGDEYEPANSENYIYYTEGHVALDEPVVEDGLSSSIQRDGISYSLGQSRQMLESATVTQTFAGTADGDYHLTVCTEEGISVRTFIELDDVVPITIVEVPEI